MPIGLGYKERSCHGKVRYKKAKQALAVAQKRGIEPYRCQFCKRWHVGHAAL